MDPRLTPHSAGQTPARSALEKEVPMSRSHLNAGTLIGAVLAIAGIATVVFGSVVIGVVAGSAGLMTAAVSGAIQRRNPHHVAR